MKKNGEYQRSRIRRRIRGKISGTTARPRLSVFRSNKQIYAQIIDDASGKTLISASSQDKGIASKTVTKIEQAKLVGQLLAEKAKEANVEGVVFDRGGYVYHGRIKSLADGAREGGLKF
ncbi:MAG: 50S ribosomal protein L18 [Bacteroidetes bacterium]|nr:MAG: 50S ribosomal protein L18 [Bacteroidota bacterium]